MGIQVPEIFGDIYDKVTIVASSWYISSFSYMIHGMFRVVQDRLSTLKIKQRVPPSSSSITQHESDSLRLD
jgi:hypothetical protein